jgi:uncharacterized protein YuzE
MKVKYDNKINAKYVGIKKGKIAYTKKEQNWLLFDCSKDGQVLGIEILDYSKHPISIQTVKDNFVDYKILELKSSEQEDLHFDLPRHLMSFFDLKQYNEELIAA